MIFRPSLSCLQASLLSACLSLSTLTCLQAQQSSGAASPGQVWHLHREEKAENVTDPATQQSHRMGIMNMLLPDGWKLNLRPAATMDCAYNDDRMFVSAATPDQTMGVVVLPAQASFYSTNRAAIQQRITFSQQFKVFACNIQAPKPFEAGMREAATKLVPDANIIGNVEPIAGLSDQLPQIVQSANVRLGGTGERLSAEAGRLRLTGTFNNHPVEMWLIVMRTMRTQLVPGGTSTLTDAPLLAVVYAPPGQLDANDRLLMTVLSSVQIDPDWTRFNQEAVARMLQVVANANATVARIHQQMAADNAAAAAQQAQIRAGAANYAAQIRSNVAQNRAAALDHSSQQFALYMGDQAIYKNPSTGENVQLSSGYDHVWASNTGNTNDYILTDSPSYNPNGQAGSASWTQLQVVH